MASLFRNMFGLGNGHSSSSYEKSSRPSKSSKSHHKSYSLPSSSSHRRPLATLDPYSSRSCNNTYVASAATYVPQVIPSSASAAPRDRDRRERRASQNSRENVPPTPSPLRYPTYNSDSVRSKYSESIYSEVMDSHLPPYPRHPSSQHHHHPPQTKSKSSRVPIYRSPTSAHGDHQPAPYPIYSSCAPSVHTPSGPGYWNSSPMSSQPRPSMPPRSSSYGSVAPSEPKPALKNPNQSWSGNSSYSTSSERPRVSFTLPRRRTALNMHPLLSHSRLNRPPISYDVTSPPSSRTVVDRSTHSPIPSFTLAQPATEPPVAGQFILTCSKLPWKIVAFPTPQSNQHHHRSTSSSSRRHRRESRESERDRRGVPGAGSVSISVSAAGGGAGAGAGAVTNFDVLYAIHHALAARVTNPEWDALGSNSRTQRKATQAYHKRCNRMQSGWESGIRRIDLLGEKTKLVGVEIEKSSEGEVGKLVFGS